MSRILWKLLEVMVGMDIGLGMGLHTGTLTEAKKDRRIGFWSVPPSDDEDEGK